MTPQKFAQTYLQFEQNIAKVLRKQKIYDEDLMHDTYIALYEYSQHAEIRDFVCSFVEFYRNQCDWQNSHESYSEPYDHNQLEAMHIIDETDWPERERALRRLDKLLRYYYTHPQQDEHHHKRSCKILRLFLKGLSEREISYKLKISQSAVHQSLQRAIDRLKTYHSHTTI